MNELSGRFLTLFAQLGKESLDLHTLFEPAGNDPTERQHVLDAADDLVREGMLEAKSGDFYALTEKGKEAVGSLECVSPVCAMVFRWSPFKSDLYQTRVSSPNRCE